MNIREALQLRHSISYQTLLLGRYVEKIKICDKHMPLRYMEIPDQCLYLNPIILALKKAFNGHEELKINTFSN